MDEKFSSITEILKSHTLQTDTDTSAENTEKPIQHTPPHTQKPSQQDTLKKELLMLRDRVNAMLELLEHDTSTSQTPTTPVYDMDGIEPQNGTIIEGVFDGQHMIDADGTQYFVPPNYASKSKLVEGDMMKLTITECGAYVYKLIAPTPRQRIIGTVVYDEHTRIYGIQVEQKIYKVLKASITFYKLQTGEQASILIPQDSPSHWAAIDNIVTTSLPRDS